MPLWIGISFLAGAVPFLVLGSKCLGDAACAELRRHSSIAAILSALLSMAVGAGFMAVVRF